jgi:hypothetical protein
MLVSLYRGHALRLERSKAVTKCRSGINRADFMGKALASKISVAHLFESIREKSFLTA